MGNIQNTINAALGGAAKGATAVAGIQAMQAGESVKALEERNKLEDLAKTDTEKLKNVSKDVRDANKEVKTAKENLQSLEDEYSKGYNGFGRYVASDGQSFDPLEAEAAWDLDMRAQMEDAGYSLEDANAKAKAAMKNKKLQKEESNKRREEIRVRVEAYNKTARRRGVSKIKLDDLYKGGKK